MGSTAQENVPAAARSFGAEGSSSASTSPELDPASWQVSASVEAISLVLLYPEDDAPLGLSQVQFDLSLTTLAAGLLWSVEYVSHARLLGCTFIPRLVDACMMADTQSCAGTAG